MTDAKKHEAASPAKDKLVFVISPIGAENSDVRHRSNLVLKRIIVPAAIRTGFKREEILRADQIPNPGMITSQIVNYITDADLVVADLTDHNPNVFYELAVRHATRKPVVLLIERTQSIPFDVSQNRAIRYDLGDWDSPDACSEQMANQIQFVLEHPDDADNPILSGAQFRALKQSGDPIGSTLADLVSNVATLQSAIDDLRHTGIRRSPMTGAGLKFFYPSSKMFLGEQAGMTFVDPDELDVDSRSRIQSAELALANAAALRESKDKKGTPSEKNSGAS